MCHAAAVLGAFFQELASGHALLRHFDPRSASSILPCFIAIAQRHIVSCDDRGLLTLDVEIGRAGRHAFHYAPRHVPEQTKAGSDSQDGRGAGRTLWRRM
jgi:hypothetical protein